MKLKTASFIEYLISGYPGVIGFDKDLSSENVKLFKSSRLYSSPSNSPQRPLRVKPSKVINTLANPLLVGPSTVKDGPVFTALNQVPVQQPRDRRPTIRTLGVQNSNRLLDVQNKLFGEHQYLRSGDQQSLRTSEYLHSLRSSIDQQYLRSLGDQDSPRPSVNQHSLRSLVDQHSIRSLGGSVFTAFNPVQQQRDVSPTLRTLDVQNSLRTLDYQQSLRSFDDQQSLGTFDDRHSLGSFDDQHSLRSLDDQQYLGSLNHQHRLDHSRPQVPAFVASPQDQDGEDTPPYEFQYDVSDVNYGTSFNVQVIHSCDCTTNDKCAPGGGGRARQC